MATAHDAMTAAVDDGSIQAQRTRHVIGQTLIYVALSFWAFVSLFPVYWTITTSMKVAKDVQLGHMIPWVDFMPTWLGWRSLGLSPDTINSTSTVRIEFMSRFLNSIITAVGASILAVLIGGLAAYGLSRFQYKFLWMRNKDISFFFLSQLILPIALPGMVAAFILSLILCWNEYFFAALLTGSVAKTLPVMVASQTGSQGINWWVMAAISTAAIAPLVVIGIVLERYIIKGLTAGAVK